MNEEQIKAMQEALAKSLPEVINPVIDEKIKEISEKSVKDLEEVKAEIKKLSLSNHAAPELKELAGQTAMVNVFKGILSHNIGTEEQFKAFVDAEMKVNAFSNEGTATEGAELVFAQFEKQVINVMKQYPVVNEVKIYTTNGKDLSIPKVTNSVTTVWTAEGAAGTPSKPTTAFVSINVYKATSLITYTEELLQDNMTIPDYYNMLVRLVGESQGAFVEDAILNGDGTQVDGLFHNTDVVNVTTLAGNVKFSDNTGEEFDNLLNDLDTAVSMEYQTNAPGLCAIMSAYTFNLLRKAKNTTTGYIMFPELREAKPMLLGKYRVIKSHKAPVQNTAADVAGASPLVIGDLSQYFGMVKRTGLTITRGFAANDFVEGKESVKAAQRFGGKPTIGAAFAKVKNAAA